MINKENIDEVLFDYLEGNLNNQEVSELTSFLEENPQYNAELEGWKGTHVAESNNAAPDFSSLKRPNKAIPYLVGGLAVSALLWWSTTNVEPAPETIQPEADAPTMVEEAPAPVMEEATPVEVTESITPEENNTLDYTAPAAEISTEESGMMVEEDIVEDEQGTAFAEERKVNLEQTESNREAQLQRVTVSSQKKDDGKKTRSKEVKVIELDSEGL